MSGTERILVRVSDVELARRWAAARAAMAERALDALVMQSSNDWLGGYAKWFTDIPPHNGYPRSVVFYADGAPMTLVDMGPFGGRRDLAGRDAIHRGVGELLTTPAFLSIDYTQDYEAELVAGALAARGCRRGGLVGPGAMPSGFVEGLRRRAGDAAFADGTETVDRVKAIKSAEEIGLIRACAALQDAVFAKVLDDIRPGMRDREICALAQQAALVLGSEQGILLGSSAPLGTRSSFLGRHMQGVRSRPASISRC